MPEMHGGIAFCRVAVLNAGAMAEALRFQHYEVQTREDGGPFELGRGAMGITYKAYDTNLRCPVALKVINHSYLNSEVAQQRFFREARAAAALKHPNVASVFHLGQEGDDFFYAMEFVEGETVDALLWRDGPLPVARALEIVLQVNRALAAADKQNLVHRDLKPANIMIQADADLVVKLIDFGLAKSVNKDDPDEATITQSGFLGTPHFASPEQLEEREVDIRSDIYSLGVTLWCMLLGKTPYSGSLAQVMSQHLYKPVPIDQLTGFSENVVALLRHMLEKDPARRPQTPLELKREIESCLQGAAGASAISAASLDDYATLVDDAPPVSLVAPVVARVTVKAEVETPPPQLPAAPVPQKSRHQLGLLLGLLAVVVVLVLGGVFAFTKLVLPKKISFVAENDAPAPAKIAIQQIPAVAAIPIPVATPVLTPDPEESYQQELAKAGEITASTEPAEAIRIYLALLKKYPGRPEIRQRLEGISARLIRDESPLAPADFAKIQTALENAASEGIIRAQLLLAQNIRTSEPDRALVLFEAVARTGDVSAIRQGGLLYSVRNRPGDMLRAVALFEQGAGLGDAGCKLAAGESYLLGKGVAKDTGKGLSYLREAAALEEPRAWDHLGDYYSREKNYAKAFEAFSKAQTLGFAPALANLGALYMNGSGVAKDPARAEALFAEGAEKGDVRAMVFHAQCLETGLGIGKDLTQARKWYESAARAGDKKAAAWLAKNGNR